MMRGPHVVEKQAGITIDSATNESFHAFGLFCRSIFNWKGLPIQTSLHWLYLRTNVPKRAIVQRSSKSETQELL